MRNRNDELQKQYQTAVDRASRRYRAGMESLSDGFKTTRDHYQDRTSDLDRGHKGRGAGRSQSDDGGSVWGVLAIAAVAGVAAVAAAPYLRRLLDEQRGEKGEGEGAQDVGATIMIQRPAQDLYDRWRHFEQFDAFMPDVIRVEPVDSDGEESDWTVRGPGGKELTFRSCITEDEPGRVIAWKSDDQPTSHSGRVTFEEMGDQTEVRLELQLHPPGGALGATVGRLLGKATGTDPRQQAERALRQFKRVMERDGGGNSRGMARAPQSDPISAMGASNGLGGAAANTQPI